MWIFSYKKKKSFRIYKIKRVGSDEFSHIWIVKTDSIRHIKI